MNHRASRNEYEAWLAVATWSLLIFVTVPVMGSVQVWVTTTFGPAVFLYATIAALLFGLTGSLIAARRVWLERNPRAVAWLLAVAAIAGGWAVHLRAQPQEAVHIIEYGVLGLLTANALRHRVTDASLFVQATLFGAMVGIVDELIQWATPGRYFDFRDIWLNAGAVALVQIGLFKGSIVPAPDPPSASSVRRVARLAIACLCLLGLCLSMTPAAVEAVAQRVPIAAALIDHQDVVVEYGHQHVVPDIGVFKSRFTPAELVTEDTNRGAEIGQQILPASRGGLYPRFLESASRAQHPFGREARLHINSRNQNMKLAREASTDDERIAHSTRAVRENRILESFFAQTVQHVKKRLPDHRVTALERRADPAAAFTSKVEPHLITFASQAGLLFALAAIVVFFVTIDLLSRRPPR